MQNLPDKSKEPQVSEPIVRIIYFFVRMNNTHLLIFPFICTIDHLFI